MGTQVYLNAWKKEEDAIILLAVKENPNAKPKEVVNQALPLLKDRSYSATITRYYHLGKSNLLEGYHDARFKKIRDNDDALKKKKDTLRILEAKSSNGTLEDGDIEMLESLRKELHPVAKSKINTEDEQQNVTKTNEPAWRNPMRKIGLLDIDEIKSVSEQQSLIFEGTLPLGGIPVKAKFKITGNFTIEILY